MPERTEDEIQGVGLVFSMKAELDKRELEGRCIPWGASRRVDEFDNFMPEHKEVDYSKILDWDMIHYGPLHK